jgi:endonuclease YncB( thermonuclease family)
MGYCQIILVCFIITSTSAAAFGFNARVVSIPDGDTVEVFKQGERYKIPITLYGIDSPERLQAFGKSAKKATVSLVGGKNVWIDIISEDRSGRLMAVITVEGKNVNETLVSEGWAWVVPDDCDQPFCDFWRRLQDEARKNRKGLWTSSQPQTPWEWRKQGKQELFYILPDKKTPVWRYSP